NAPRPRHIWNEREGWGARPAPVEGDRRESRRRACPHRETRDLPASGARVPDSNTMEPGIPIGMDVTRSPDRAENTKGEQRFPRREGKFTMSCANLAHATISARPPGLVHGRRTHYSRPLP